MAIFFSKFVVKPYGQVKWDVPAKPYHKGSKCGSRTRAAKLTKKGSLSFFVVTLQNDRIGGNKTDKRDPQMVKFIYETEEEIQAHKSLTDVIGLQDLVIVSHEFDEVNDRTMLISVPRWPVAVCTDCSRPSCDIHDYPNQRTIHDTQIGGRPTVLVFDSRRFECPHCGNIFMEVISDVVGSCSYTYRLMAEIVDAKRKQAISTLAETYQLGYKLVESIILKAGKEKIEGRKKEPIKVKELGIDEISLHKGQGKYVLVLTDLERRIVLDILSDRLKKSLITWLKNPPAGIDLSTLETAAIDLWAQYREAVKSVYPIVEVVADRFHVVQNLNETIHDIRRETQTKAENEAEQKTLKGLRYLLLKNEKKLTEADKKRLKKLKKTHPALYRLCELRQELHDWYETDTTPQKAEVTLDKWIEKAKLLGFTPLNKFCNTLTNWKSEIVNFFANRITSGFVEGMNSKIKLLKRIAFGIPNFEHFRLRILWACG
jgi:transposase